TMLSYRTHAEKESMYNTPPTFGIYIISLVLRWIRDAGGLAAIEARNQSKAAELYHYLDQSQLFRPVADASCRSLMNVCFDTGNAETDAEFISRAEAAGFSGLKGHRSVGGMRASLYNAFPPEGVTQLVEFMRDFEHSSQAS
ncbi:MAG: aminotransferase class V-fold PLP-dependent enzyme, partial [Planctomycetaceae bacterium]|nr:aminotransferase class V-fold PLP-dependent enzyme [Planctomycetaceae bacterium]